MSDIFASIKKIDFVTNSVSCYKFETIDIFSEMYKPVYKHVIVRVRVRVTKYKIIRFF